MKRFASMINILLMKYEQKVGENVGAENKALLNNHEGFTVFRYGTHTIRFRAPYSLERYTEVKKWDRGYLVVMAKYVHNEMPEEEYIDLIPILKDLYFDVDEFLEPIKEVLICYGETGNQ